MPSGNDASRSSSALPLRTMALLAVAFGLLTLKEGGSVLFGGAYVPFVLWFNFGAGFAYVVAGLGMGLRQRWAAPLAALIAAATALTFAVLGVHIAQGGAFEMRTVAAMALRTTVWAVLAWLAFRHLGRQHSPNLLSE